MNVGGLLHRELWSKATSRRIFVGIGIACGLVLVGVLALSVIQKRWLTRGERSAARAALVQIDELENLVQSSDQDFSAKARAVQKSIDLADDAAWTVRDRQIVAELMGYSLKPVIDRHTFRTQMPIKHELDEKLNSSGIKSYRMDLHRVLD
jgi:hypothetical protein